MTNNVKQEERIFQLFKQGLRDAKNGKSVTAVMRYIRPELERYTLTKELEALQEFDIQAGGVSQVNYGDIHTRCLELQAQLNKSKDKS